ncbi:MAG TPA: hypothetical protein VJW94_17355 [Candidatus Acidoferrum sp.]|nr:hypothetical protein [Candidatus Acidoferrum sp.]
MAEETLVKEPLTTEMIEVGRDMTSRLLDNGFELACSLWFYDAESNRWRLVLASPVVDLEGPIRAYEQIEEILQDNWEMGIWLRDISAVGATDPLVAGFRSLGRIELLRPRHATADRVTTARRYTRGRVGDNFVEDAYVYLVA